MTAAEHVAAILTALEARATAGGTGSVTVTIDGTTTTYDEDQALRTLRFWQREAARESGARKIVRTLDLRNAF